MRIKRELCIIFTTDEDYNKAIKVIDAFEELENKIESYKDEYNLYDEQLVKFFDGVRFDKKNTIV